MYSILGGKEKIKISDIVGDPPLDMPGAAAAAPEPAPKDKIQEWKETALSLGLKIGGE